MKQISYNNGIGVVSTEYVGPSSAVQTVEQVLAITEGQLISCIIVGSQLEITITCTKENYNKLPSNSYDKSRSIQ
jgi:hypothetical protein